jgi:RHS repeat-associated protein
MAMTSQLSENSHQGFEGIKAALCLGSMKAKSNTASGMPVCLWQEGIGSRSSGKERDNETGLDYFGARYYSGAQGRWTSPDEPFADQHPEDPQSWNLYAYVRNNPITNTDPNGKDCTQGVSNCISFLIGGLQSVANIIPDALNMPNHLINAAISPFTDYKLGDVVPPLQAVDSDMREGQIAGTGAMVVAGVGEILGASKIIGAAADEATVTRYMGPGEAAVVDRTGSVPNVNAEGAFRPTHVTIDSPLNSSSTAQKAYELPSSPSHRATVPKSRVNDLQTTPDGRVITSGGGSQAATHKPIRVMPYEIKKLKK